MLLVVPTPKLELTANTRKKTSYSFILSCRFFFHWLRLFHLIRFDSFHLLMHILFLSLSLVFQLVNFADS